MYLQWVHTSFTYPDLQLTRIADTTWWEGQRDLWFEADLELATFRGQVQRLASQFQDAAEAERDVAHAGLHPDAATGALRLALAK